MKIFSYISLALFMSVILISCGNDQGKPGDENNSENVKITTDEAKKLNKEIIDAKNDIVGIVKGFSDLLGKANMNELSSNFIILKKKLDDAINDIKAKQLGQFPQIKESSLNLLNFYKNFVNTKYSELISLYQTDSTKRTDEQIKRIKSIEDDFKKGESELLNKLNDAISEFDNLEQPENNKTSDNNK